MILSRTENLYIQGKQPESGLIFLRSGIHITLKIRNNDFTSANVVTGIAEFGDDDIPANQEIEFELMLR